MKSMEEMRQKEECNYQTLAPDSCLPPLNPRPGAAVDCRSPIPLPKRHKQSI